MHELRRLFWFNIIAYFSFLLYLLLGLNKHTSQHRIFLIVIPITLLILTLFIFVSKRDQRLVYIKYYTIPDFIVRLVSLELCVVGSVFCHDFLGLTIVLMVLIVLFAINLTLEKTMSIRITHYPQNTDNIMEDKGQVLVSLGVSYVETILLLFMLLFPYNLTSSMNISGYVVWGSVLMVLLLFYIRRTLLTLYAFYKKEREVRHFFIVENAGVFALLIILSLYGYFLGFTTIADGIFYLSSLLLLLPRQIIRMRRLSAGLPNKPHG